MTRGEYDDLIRRQYIARIGFGTCPGAYVAPFMYVFDGKYIYFLATRYGRKMEYFKKNPTVSVEIEEYAPDLSSFQFVSLQGSLQEPGDESERQRVREMFSFMILERGLSPHVLSAIGHSPGDPVATIRNEDRAMIWKLMGVKDIVALKNG